MASYEERAERAGDELRRKLDLNKIRAFELMHVSSDVDPKIMGYKTFGDFCAATIAKTRKDNEKLMKDFEAEFPGT